MMPIRPSRDMYGLDYLVLGQLETAADPGIVRAKNTPSEKFRTAQVFFISLITSF
jgi:hypothetical protein